MIEMSVDKETVTIGNTKANSTPPLQLQHPSEYTGSYNNASIMTDVNPDSTDGAASCPMPANMAQEKQTSPAESHNQTEHVEVGARLNDNHLNRRNGVQQPKQQQQQQQQQKLSKRRSTTSAGFKHPQSGKRRRRANSESDCALPTNFLLGGNIFDPLNLNSLLDEEVNRALNAETPKSSPLPAKHQDPVEILIPRDITDPLNLNSGGAYGSFLVSPFKRRRNRNRHHGAGGGAVGVSAPRQDPADLERASEVNTSASSLPAASSASGNLEVCRAGSAPPSVARSSRSHEPNPSSSKEEAAPPAPDPQAQPRGPEDPSASAGGPNQHPGRTRRRRRFSGKTEPPVVQSTPTGKPWTEDRGGGVGAGRGLHSFHTPGGAGSKSCPGGRHQRKHQHKDQHKARFQYGNYNKYYGYRNPGSSEDPRFRVLRPEWFQGKDVLDLGCNTGHLTLCIAKWLRPARILGLDIDGGLVHAARQNIRHYLSDMKAQEARRAADSGKEDEERPASARGEEKGEETQKGGETEREEQGRGRPDPTDGVRAAENGNAKHAAKTERGSARAAVQQTSGPSTGGAGEEATAEQLEPAESTPADRPGHRSFPVSLRITRGPIAAPPLTETPTMPPGDFPANVSFLKVNYVLENDALLATQRPEYDIILCMSVTKWVHLNWGDSGLKRLFHRVYRHLRPGGRFILEPQPWETYAKRKMLTDSIYRNYHSICLRPDQFSTYLTSEVGFSSYELIGMPKNSSRGFQRPIYLFHK